VNRLNATPPGEFKESIIGLELSTRMSFPPIPTFNSIRDFVSCAGH